MVFVIDNRPRPFFYSIFYLCKDNRLLSTSFELREQNIDLYLDPVTVL